MSPHTPLPWELVEWLTGDRAAAYVEFMELRRGKVLSIGVPDKLSGSHRLVCILPAGSDPQKATADAELIVRAVNNRAFLLERIATLEEAAGTFHDDFNRYFGNGTEGRASPKFFDLSLNVLREALRPYQER